MRPSGGRRGQRPMIVVGAFAVLVFIYLVYALIHPEKF
ncbi:K(+)-transporting ATPase subunit F [Paenibacillus sp. S28]|nr:K(+)-transporting ATPase subunit F [Paenibacillus sp. S28]PQP86044.1 K(+)-transporting ATPase subunit F [Paenibacillus sp. AR247]UYO04785.1 K(+)-transporting ATPase subunit F [Paenibacillus sp. PSB04]